MDLQGKENSSENPGDVAARILEAIQHPIEEQHVTMSSEGADLTVPPSQEELIRGLLDRLSGMTEQYTLGLDHEESELFVSIKAANEGFFFDRPLTDEEILHDTSGRMKAQIKRFTVPVLKNLLSTVFERQRDFNAHMVKIVNRFVETFGIQRDFNMDVIKFCERMIDHYRLMEETERRLDDFFSTIVRIGILEEDVDHLKSRLDNLENKLQQK